MTQHEKLAVEYLLKTTEHPSATAAVYDGGLQRAEGGVGHMEAMRLLNSADYKAGWLACREYFREALVWIPTAPQRDLKRYHRQN